MSRIFVFIILSINSLYIATTSASSQCGVRNPNGIDINLSQPTEKENAQFGEFPWTIAILDKNSTEEHQKLICRASLIAPNVVLSAAHCFYRSNLANLIVRAGEWNTSATNELYPYQETTIKHLVLHENFSRGNLSNDIALLILNNSFTLQPHIGTVCLPEQGIVYNSTKCFLSTWTEFGRGRILKKYVMPLILRERCQKELGKTHLQLRFILDESFICAGVDETDTCPATVGSPFVCPDVSDPNRYVLFGLTSWGENCSFQDISRVLVNVAHFRTWIDQQLEIFNIN